MKQVQQNSEEGRKENTIDVNSAFEDILAKFKKNIEEKMSDIVRNLDSKRSPYSKGNVN